MTFPITKNRPFQETGRHANAKFYWHFSSCPLPSNLMDGRIDTDLIKGVGEVAGLGGICVGVLLLLYKNLLTKIVPPRLSDRQWYRIVMRFMVLVWSIAVLGIVAWIYALTIKPGPGPFPTTPVWQQQLKIDSEGVIRQREGSEASIKQNSSGDIVIQTKILDMGTTWVVVPIRPPRPITNLNISFGGAEVHGDLEGSTTISFRMEIYQGDPLTFHKGQTDSKLVCSVFSFPQPSKKGAASTACEMPERLYSPTTNLFAVIYVCDVWTADWVNAKINRVVFSEGGPLTKIP